MTTGEFNEKYKDYLEEGHYGLDINNEKVIEYLDKLFPILIKDHPNFQYSQIKTKFNSVRFYCNLDYEISSIIEKDLKQILDGSNN